MAKRKAASGDIGSLLTEWEQTELRFREESDDEFGGGIVPDLDESQAFAVLTAKLSAWCDQSPVNFDPTPLLAVSLLVRRVANAAPLAGVTREVPPQLFGEWFTALESARILIQRIRIYLDAGGGKAADSSPAMSKDAQAIALLFSMESPTKNKIAKAMGYTDRSGSVLDRLPKFKAAWEKFQTMQTIMPGAAPNRPGSQRWNGKPMTDEEDMEDDGMD